MLSGEVYELSSKCLGSQINVAPVTSHPLRGWLVTLAALRRVDFAQPDLDLLEAGPVRHRQGHGVAVVDSGNSPGQIGGRQRRGQQQEGEEGDDARNGGEGYQGLSGRR